MRGYLSAHRYLIALGSNMRVPGVGAPCAVIAAALAALEEEGPTIAARSRTIVTDPVGPSRRRYANAAALVETDLAPDALLALTQSVEADFGRRRRGRSWRARPLDIDLVLWSGGIYVSPALAIPHPAYRERPFVLGPAAEIAPDWRDPLTGQTLRRLQARLTAPRPLPSAPGRQTTRLGP